MIGGVAATNVVVVNGTTITLTVPAKAATCGAMNVVVSNPDGKTGSANNILRYTSRTFGLMAAQNTTANGLNGPPNLVIADFNPTENPMSWSRSSTRAWCRFWRAAEVRRLALRATPMSERSRARLPLV